MLFLGISDLGHDPAVAVIGERGPLAAIEERKLSRSSNGRYLPESALRYALRESGVTTADLTGLATAGRVAHANRREVRLKNRFPIRAGQRSTSSAPERGSRDPARLQALRGLLDSTQPIESLEHHLCHAASAFYPSDADRALVITLDQAGDMWSGLVALGEGTQLRPLKTIRFPDSLGLVYSDVTSRLGFRPRSDEHKTQWLSTRGTPSFASSFRRLVSPDANGLPTLNRRYLTREIGGSWRLTEDFYASLGLPAHATPGPDLSAEVACSVQNLLEETVVELAERYRERFKAKSLCVAGGVFLNVLLVRALEERTGFESVFVQPAAGNTGTALGAAYLARAKANGHSQREPLSHLYLGPGVTASEIKQVLDNCKVVYRYLPRQQLLDSSVSLLQDGKSLGWFQDRMEFGDRALGNRSILASPVGPYVKENLNTFIKHREEFHPFILSVPAEAARLYFDNTGNCRFAASVATVRAGVKYLDPFMFGRRHVRLHVVERETNPKFWSLLQAFGQKAHAPILVNTSFNLFGEALVCTPRDAIRTFYCSGIDALVMGDFLLVK